MRGVPFTYGAELRHALQERKSGGYITLEAGVEYQGPFIIDKPMTLAGQGPTTTLFGQDKPAVVILSPGVTLTNLLLTDAFDPQTGVCLLVDQSASPTLTHVKTHGQVETLAHEQLINFGEILADQTASTFVSLDVAEPTKIECTHSSSDWLRLQAISPNHTDAVPDKAITLSAAGRQMVRLIYIGGALMPDDIALGQILIKSQNATSTLWVYVQLVPSYASQPLEGNLVLTTDKKQRIRVDESFLIGHNNFPDISDDDPLAEQQAFILRDNNQAWAIFQPWASASPTQVNGTPMGIGQRVWLNQGDIIEAGSLRLSVSATNSDRQYAVDKSEIDLGSTVKPAKKACVYLTYQGRKRDQVSLNTHIDWIQLEPTLIDVKAGSVHQITVSLTPEAKNLPPQKYIELDAILISGQKDWLALDVLFEVKPPRTAIITTHPLWQAITEYVHHSTLAGAGFLAQKWAQIIAEIPASSHRIFPLLKQLQRQATDIVSSAIMYIVRLYHQLAPTGFHQTVLQSKPLMRWSHLSRFIRKSFNLPNQHKMSYASIALIGIVFCAILIGVSLFKRQQREQAYHELVTVARDKLMFTHTVEPNAALAALAEAEIVLGEAELIKTNSPETASLRQQLTDQIDQLTNVQRLSALQQLFHYTDVGTDMDSIVVQGDTVYTLDMGNNQVYRHHLSLSGNVGLVEADTSVITKPEQSPTSVNQLLAMAKVPQTNNPNTSNLAMLDQHGLLIYQSDADIITRALNQDDLFESSVAIAGYFGNFYLLRPQHNVFLRYLPHIDGYSQPPESYFPPGRNVDLTNAVDIAIDGAVYFLYHDGRVEKYWGADPVEFALKDIDKPLNNPVAIFTGPDLQYLYIVDQGNQRIVQLHKDGHFVRQFKLSTTETASFANLQDIAVDEAGNRLFLLHHNKLYISPLPITAGLNVVAIENR